VFPYTDGEFDVVYAASVFTHLLPPAVLNYFKESRRVLREGGCSLFSFFVLDAYRGKGTTGWDGYEFDHPLPGYEGVAVHDPTRPELLIAYETARLERMAADAGLTVERLLPGFWSNTHPASVNEQDLILMRAT
jgi:SAM-dependent methyltransferase